MKGTCLLVLFSLGFILSCGTGPEPVDDVTYTTLAPVYQFEPAEADAPVVVPEEEKPFDPGSISEEIYAAAKADIQVFIGNLNRIIRARNYNAWVGYLADSYFRTISSRGFLEEKTEELYKRDVALAASMGRNTKMVEKRVLRNPVDYFTYVVAPSRSNDRVDDIAFISETRVRAYTVNDRGNRLVLYDLVLIDHGWKIIG